MGGFKETQTGPANGVAPAVQDELNQSNAQRSNRGSASPAIPKLFDRDRLGQIPRLINIGSEKKRCVVGEKLQGKSEHERRD